MRYSMPVYFYDKDKNYTTLIIMSSMATWTANKVYRKVALVSPPTGSKFARVIMICGGTALTSSGRMTIDNVMVDNMGVVRDIITYDDSTSLSSGTQATTAWESFSTFYIDLPRSNSTYTADITFEHGQYTISTFIVSTGGSTEAIRFRKGTTYLPQTELYKTSSSTSIAQSNHIKVTIKTTGGRVPINAEHHGTTGYSYISKKTSPISDCHMLPLST